MALGGVVIAWFLFWAMLGGGIGLAIGHPKGHGGIGFFLGLFLGFFGWIIVAVMKPSHEVQSVQQAETIALAASMVALREGHSGDARRAAGARGERPCPWCAESIKAAARVCRFCHRDIEPLAAGGGGIDVTSDAGVIDSAILDAIRAEYPAQFDDAREWLQRLSPPPVNPAAWLCELSKRMAAGSPADAAAARIPLDWEGPVPRIEVLPAPPVISSIDLDHEDGFADIETRHPASYDQARRTLGALPNSPANPRAWLEELCERIDQGSPPAAAASRIPLDWRGRSSGWTRVAGSGGTSEHRSS